MSKLVVTTFGTTTPRQNGLNDVSSKKLRLRPGQTRAFDDLHDERLAILNGPTGWGKSLLLVGLAGKDLLDNPERKAIVVIPQCIISKGFVTSLDLELPDGRALEWRIRNNLCVRADQKVEQLRRFILSPAGRSLAERVVVTTNMGFVAAYQTLEADQLVRAFQDTTLILDEAHHIQASDESFNLLGGAVNVLLSANDPSVRMVLSTAYFFRGDRLPIIPESHLQSFVRHHVPFDEHWAQLRYLESYRYDFVAFKGTVWSELESLLRHSQEPTIIYCPPNGHKLHLGKNKDRFVRRVISQVKKHYPDTVVWQPNVEDFKGKRVILDLVDRECRAEKVQFAMRHGDQIAAIITVGMFKEGADWVQASRAIDLVPTGSDQDRNQRFGRLIRDFPGKSCASYFSFFPHITDEGKGKQREQLTKLFAHFHASLVLENALNPLRIPVEKPADAQGREGGGQPENFLGNYDSQKQEAIIRDSCEQLISLAADKAAMGQAVSPEDARQAIRKVLEEQHGITEHQDELAKQIMLVLRRRQNANLPSEELVRAGFDKVWSMETLEGLVLFSGGIGGPSTFREIRQTIDTVFERQWMEMLGKVRLMPFAPDSQSTSYWWCTHNKVLFKQGRLSPDKIQLLESVPWWSWSEAFADRWMKQHEGIRLLPKCPQSGTPEYDWIRSQRRLYEGGKLPRERIILCEAIPWWSWASNEGNWRAMYDEIAVLPEPPNARTREYDWVKHQRNMYAKGRLAADRIELLQQIRWWSWNTSTDSRWEEHWEEIKELPAPPSSTGPEYYWIRKQRKRHADGTLEPERIAKCEAISWWSWS